MLKALNQYLLSVILILGAQYSMAFRNHNLLEDSLIDSIESLYFILVVTLNGCG